MPKGHYERKLSQNKGKYAVGTKHETSQGVAVVLERVDYRHVLIRFENTGYVTKCSNANLKTDKVKNHRLPSVYGVGYLDGIKVAPRGSEQRRAYDLWSNMLKRCYHEHTGASVSPEWHSFRTFQNSLPDIPGWEKFVSGEDVHLDKDIRVPGNKVYSLRTCSFVSAHDNVMDCLKRRWGTE